MKQVHVLCCNDVVEAVVLNESDKDDVLNKVRNGHKQRHRYIQDRFFSYDNTYFWHYHTVNILPE